MGRESKMPPSQRAKQFLPFDAVAGLREALRKKEHEMGLTGKKELSEEMSEEINEALHDIRKGSRVSIAYFRSAGGPGADIHGSGQVELRDADLIETPEDGGSRPGDMVLITGEVTGIDGMSRTVTVRADDAEDDPHGFTEETVVDIDDIASIDLLDDGLL